MPYMSYVCFVVALLVDDVRILKWLNYVGLAILTMYVFLVQYI